MNKKTMIVLTVPLMLLGHAQVSAQESRFAFGPKIGTTGVGAEVSVALTDTLSFRGAYSVFEYDTDFDDTDVSYDAEFDKNSVSLLLDWNPGNSGFRITGGAYSHSDNRVDVLATPNGGTYTFNGNDYDASDVGTVSGNVGFEKTTPYLGIGWGNLSRAKGLSFMLDIGVQMQDSPTVNLAVNGCTLPTAVCTQLQNDLQAEALELEEEGEDFEFWPVVNLGLYYRF